MVKKLIPFGIVFALVLLLGVGSAHAQVSSSTLAAAYTTAETASNQMIAAAITSILVALAALVGLGWATRHFMRKITGRKF